MKIKNLVLTFVFAILFAQIPVFSTDLEKVAVIDVQKVISSSKQVKALKKEKASRNKELKSFEKKCQSEIKKESDLAKKKELSKKYKKQLADKKSFYANDYAVKIKLINRDINDKIAKIAQEMGYEMVVRKSAVVMFDKDITEEVIKVVK